MSRTPETIEKIEEYAGNFEGEKFWRSEEQGYRITTDHRIITLAIDSDQSCCEDWGYFLSEDDIPSYEGATLINVEVTDTNRTGRDVVRGSYFDRKADGEYVEPSEDAIVLDEGDVMFVDIKTNRGTLQFVAYNAHNGYYGHTARIYESPKGEVNVLAEAGL